MYKVIDTNVILLDARNIIELGKDGDVVVIPETVVDEVDSKKSLLSEIGYQARQFGRLMSDAKVILVTKANLGEDHTVEPNITQVHCLLGDTSIIIISKKVFKTGRDIDISIYNDRKIIEIATDVREMYQDSEVVFISNDVMCRTRALAEGLVVDSFSTVENDAHVFNKHLVIEDPEVFRTAHNRLISDLDPTYTVSNRNYTLECLTTGATKLGIVVRGRFSVLSKEYESELARQNVAPINSGQKYLSMAIQEPMIDVVIVDAAAGSGKAQPLSEPVLTDAGWKPMGDITVGTRVIGSDGKSVKVIGIHPQGVRDVYEVGFIDGTSVRCDIDHIWKVRDRNSGAFDEYRTLTVRDMLKSWLKREQYDGRYGTYQNTYRYSIPTCEACEFGADNDIRIHPYALGLLLGDGCFGDSVDFTNGSLELIEKLKAYLEPEYTIKNIQKVNSHYRGYISMGTANVPFNRVLEYYGLHDLYSVEKFVPVQYLHGTLETRRHVFQGLTDTDGYVRNGRVNEYSTSSARLAADYLELGRSLGRVFTINKRIPKYTYKGAKLEGKESYRIREMVSKPKSIVSITKLGRELCQCISVDAEDHLYVTAGYNLTHNTLVALSNAMRLLDTKPYTGILYVRNSVQDLEKNEELGFLKGDITDKTGVFFTPLQDVLYFMAKNKLSQSKLKGKDLEDAIQEKIDALTAHYRIESLITLGMRGRTFTDKVIIIDECLHEDQTISTTKGVMCIKDVELLLAAGEHVDVMSVNIERGVVEAKPLVSLKVDYIHDTNEKMYEVTMEDDTQILVTGNHKLWDGEHYVTINDMCDSKNYECTKLPEFTHPEVQRGTLKIKSIREIEYSGRIYTPQVMDNENYILGNGVLSKNCQSLSPSSMQKILTRIGKNCKVIIIGSQNQIDNSYLTRHTNGLAVLLDACSKELDTSVVLHPVEMPKTVRSPLTELAEQLFSTHK